MSAYQSLMLSCFEGRLDDVKHLLQNDLKDAFLPLCTHDAYGRMPLHLGESFRLYTPYPSPSPSLSLSQRLGKVTWTL